MGKASKEIFNDLILDRSVTRTGIALQAMVLVKSLTIKTVDRSANIRTIFINLDLAPGSLLKSYVNIHSKLPLLHSTLYHIPAKVPFSTPFSHICHFTTESLRCIFSLPVSSITILSLRPFSNTSMSFGVLLKVLKIPYLNVLVDYPFSTYWLLKPYMFR